MYKSAFLVFIFAAAYGALHFYTFEKPAAQVRKPQSVEANPYGIPNNCTGKKYCITVFVAPWCPICKGEASTFRILNSYLLQNRTDIGFGLVMSSGTVEQNRNERDALAPIEVTLDDSSQILRTRQIQGFPTWTVTDAANNETFHKPGAILAKDASEVPHLLSELGL